MRALPATIPVLAALLSIYLVAPFVAGGAQFGLADWSRVDGAALTAASAVSLASASVATLLVGLSGVPLGYILARRTGRGLAALGFVVQLPLALPPLSSGVLLLFLFGYSAPLGQLAGGRLTDSFAGIVLAQTFVAAPFLIIAARSAFAAIDPQLEAVTATLGHGPAAVFRIVSLPLASRAILAGLLLTWLRAFGEFGATVLVAYHPYSLPVFTYVAFGSEGLPAMLPVLVPTLSAAALVMGLSLWLGRGPTRAAGAAPTFEATPPVLPPAIAPRGASIDFAIARHLPRFTLDVAWTTSARRLAVLGASGSGKSMLLRVVAGLDEAAGARLRVGPVDLAGRPPEARNIAYVPQGYALLPHLTVERQVRLADDPDEAAARRWTARLGLSGLEQRLPHELSLGQQQRVALARALSRRGADLLLLDEPFSALDVALRRSLRHDLLALQAEVSATTIIVTHDPDEAMLLADELLLIDRGRVLRAGPVDEVMRRPGSEAAARLLGATTVGTGRVTRDGLLDLGDGVPVAVVGPRLQTGCRVGWAVRPHRIRIAACGLHDATPIARGPSRGGRRAATWKLGETLLSLEEDDEAIEKGWNRLEIPPDALQVWAL